MPDYLAYLSAAVGTVYAIDTATGTIKAQWGLDSPQGITATPDGSQVYATQTGQYSVVAIDTATSQTTQVTVGAYPQGIAATVDGTAVWAAVTGPNTPSTGPGGFSQVAVISTATNTVSDYLTVGASPRQLVFSPDGSRAYITTESSIDFVSTASGRLVHRIPAPDGPQNVALSPDGGTLYVTNPVAGTLWAIDTARPRCEPCGGRGSSRTPSRSRPTAAPSTSRT